MIVDCPGCRGTGVETTGKAENTRCAVCWGMRWVDPDEICKCGRAATHQDPESKVLYCGRLSCAPKKEQHGTH